MILFFFLFRFSLRGFVTVGCALLCVAFVTVLRSRLVWFALFWCRFFFVSIFLCFVGFSVCAKANVYTTVQRASDNENNNNDNNEGCGVWRELISPEVIQPIQCHNNITSYTYRAHLSCSAILTLYIQSPKHPPQSCAISQKLSCVREQIQTIEEKWIMCKSLCEIIRLREHSRLKAFPNIFSYLLRMACAMFDGFFFSFRCSVLFRSLLYLTLGNNVVQVDVFALQSVFESSWRRRATGKKKLHFHADVRFGVDEWEGWINAYTVYSIIHTVLHVYTQRTAIDLFVATSTKLNYIIWLKIGVKSTTTAYSSVGVQCRSANWEKEDTFWKFSGCKAPAVVKDNVVEENRRAAIKFAVSECKCNVPS